MRKLVYVLTVQSDDRNHCYPEKRARPVGGVNHGEDYGHYENNHHRNDAPNDSRGQIAAAEEIVETRVYYLIIHG